MPHGWHAFWPMAAFTFPHPLCYGVWMPPIHHLLSQDPQTGAPSHVVLRDNGPILMTNVTIPGQSLGTSHRTLVDVGARFTLIEQTLVSVLGLQPDPSVIVTGARVGGHPQTGQPFLADLAFPNTPLAPHLNHPVVAYDIHGTSPHLDLIIGRDILQHYVLVYDGGLGVVTLAR